MTRHRGRLDLARRRLERLATNLAAGLCPHGVVMPLRAGVWFCQPCKAADEEVAEALGVCPDCGRYVAEPKPIEGHADDCPRRKGEHRAVEGGGRP